MSLLFSFDGRIGRGKFWLGNLVVILLVIAILAPGNLMVPWEQVTVTDADGQPTIDVTNPAMLPLGIAYVFIFFAMWITLAISAKRFHDRGKSGWWYLITFIPLIGVFWWLIELGFLRGDPGPNAYGPPAVPA